MQQGEESQKSQSGGRKSTGMARGLYLFLSLLLLKVSSSSLAYAGPVNPQPHELRSFKIREEKVQDNNQQQLGRGCSYTVKIKTSCSSPRYTRDAVSLAFGDAYRNEVYVPRLDDPSSKTFERCSTDTFNIQGPCGYGICYLYLYRNGWDGWIPDSVKVYEVSYRRAITFYYGTPLPNAIWYGFNQCSRISVPSANATELASQ
ncbi:embryo-specific protein ATS3B-like [Iris pallida]|uniref:Embryo-specific protein ATS3B-like n=1 Tax=Iris pallida TaxID=29817 RepID=A0AAX6H8M1_IRIPA|nr:embryo-specific protein ATS3B-like [Iris pallida]